MSVATSIGYECRVFVVEYENAAKHNLEPWTAADQKIDDAQAKS